MRRPIKLLLQLLGLGSKDLPGSVVLCCVKYMKKDKPELPSYNSDLGMVLTAIWFMFGRKITLFWRWTRRTRKYREQLQACQGTKSCQSGTCDGCFHRVESARLWMQLFSWVRQVLKISMREDRSKISKREMREFSDCLNLISSSATFQDGWSSYALCRWPSHSVSSLIEW